MTYLLVKKTSINNKTFNFNNNLVKKKLAQNDKIDKTLKEVNKF